MIKKDMSIIFLESADLGSMFKPQNRLRITGARTSNTLGKCNRGDSTAWTPPHLTIPTKQKMSMYGFGIKTSTNMSSEIHGWEKRLRQYIQSSGVKSLIQCNQRWKGLQTTRPSKKIEPLALLKEHRQILYCHDSVKHKILSVQSS